MKISEINELGEGMHVDRVEALMATVFNRDEKMDKKGRPYTLQNAYITQGSDKIKVSFWNHPDLTRLRGKNVTLRSKPPKSFITVGKYKDQTQLSVPREVLVLGDGEVEDSIPMDDPIPKDDGARATLPKTQQNPPQVNVERKQAVPEGGVNDVKRAVMQYSNLRYICDHAASALYAEQQTGMVEKGIVEKIKDVSSCFFIQGIRDGLHHKLPNNKPLSKHVEATEELESKEEVPF